MKNKVNLSIRLIIYQSFFLLFAFPMQVFSQLNPADATPKYEIPDLKYPSADAFVITYNVMDYGADNTGATDNSALFTALLRKLGTTAGNGGVGNGGVLFLPEGKYLVNSSLTIPKGVTIRGEWKKPEKGKPIVGTIIMTNLGRNNEAESNALIKLQPSAAVKDLAFWYPEQKADNIVPYPPTILWGSPGYFGNEYCVAQNVTLINSYSGVIFSRQNGGGAPNAFGIYGTPLKRGIEIDNIAEVGRVEGVDFSPEYWIGSGLKDAPASESSIKKWIQNNGTGIVMRRNDWSYTTDINVDGYFIGFHAVTSMVGDRSSKPNGQNYKMNFTNCKTAVYAEDPQSVGVMFHDVNIVDCEYGLFVPRYAGGTVQLSNWNIKADKYAIGIDSNSSTNVLFNQSTITSGKIEALGGTLVIIDSDINNEAPQIKIGAESRAIITGNRFAEEVEIENKSMYECQIDHEPIADLKKIPEFPYKDPQTIKQKPNRIALYVVTADEFGAKPNDDTIDNTQAIQKALDKAKADGGGIVYLPVGKYRVLGHLTIPSGVELKGSMDVGSVPTGPGSILEVYENKGNPTGTPFLALEENSGIRGVVFNYPEQKFTDILAGTGRDAIINPHEYPYTIQVKGKDVYIVNVGFRTVFSGIDLFTHKCDNVYIEYPSGHMFTNGIRIGGGTENARICNAQFNTIGYACGQETKFGCWPNSPIDQPSSMKEDNMPAYRQNWRDLHFFIIEDCKNLLLFNNFHFGCNVGTVLGSETSAPTGIAMGHGIDSAIKALYFNQIGEEGFDFIGSQIVSTREEVPGGGNAARYIQTSSDFTGEVTLFSADFWGQPYYAVELGGGILNFQTARFDNLGSQRFVEVDTTKESEIRIWGSSIKPETGRTQVNVGGESHFFAESSIIDSGSTNADLFASYIFNLSNSSKIVFENEIDRTNWIATASKNNNNAIRAIDDDASTRWDTSSSMQPGDWFMVNMQEAQTFNKILLDQGSSGGDYPRGYEVYVSDDENDWGEAIATGRGTSNMTTITLSETQTKQFIKIQQTGQDGLYWSIHEFYIALMEDEVIEYPTPLPVLINKVEIPDVKIYTYDGQLYVKGLADNARINIYNLSGQLVKVANNNTDGFSVQLTSGVYIIVADNGGQVYRQKVVIK